MQRGTRNIFNALHQLDETVVVGGAHGRKADAAIAHDGCRDAMPARRLQPRVPCRLTIIMGVNIDKARRDETAFGVDFFGACARNLADSNNETVADGDIGLAQRGAQAVGQGAAAYDEIMCMGHDSASPRSGI